MDKDNTTHGGRRPGAGRPVGTKRAETTVVKRIPLKRWPAVEALLDNVIAFPHRGNVHSFIPAAQNPTTLELPVVGASIAAGFPSPADDYIQGTLDLNELLIDSPSSTYHVRVSGDSMIEDGIMDGDYLIVDRRLKAVKGSTIVAYINGEFTVKRYYHHGSYIELQPANKRLQSLKVTSDQEFSIWGVVRGTFRKLV